MRADACLRCGQELNTAAALPGSNRRPGGPKAGDLSICFYCGQIAIWGEDMALRHLTQADIDDDPESYRVAQDLVASMDEWRKAQQ